MINLVCPDCQTDLINIDKDGNLACENCQLVYPSKDGIYIILAKPIRNFNLEYPLLKELAGRKQYPTRIKEYIENTLKLVESHKGSSTWEWDDEKFWTERHNINPGVVNSQYGHDRLWQREPLIRKLLSCINLNDKTVLDIGAGGGLTSRKLILKYADSSTLYVAVDISFAALRNNRALNLHTNSTYIVCSDDYALPFKKETIDVICYFGVLHHTRNKANNIQKDRKLLNCTGYMMLAEAVDRPTIKLPWLGSEDASAHEENVGKQDILRQTKNFSILFLREETTIILTALMLTTSKIILKNKKMFQSIVKADSLVASTIGNRNKFLQGGELLLLLKNTSLSI